MNCWCLSLNDPVKPFCFAFNELMLGGGVGFNLQKENVYEMPPVKYDVAIVRRDEKDVDYIVPDNREGWIELLRRTLESFFVTGKSFSFSTICIRPKGARIKGFGGVASGPEDLCQGIEQIAGVLSSRHGKKLRPIDCLDVMNIIGSIVVSGNVRRSAQLALGDPDDYQFLSAKDWSKHKLPPWRNMSNNSVACNSYEHLTDSFWKGYGGEGESYGMINLKNCRTYGRLIDGTDYRPDPKVVGTNPCLVGSTLVYVADGRGNVPIRQLAEAGKDVPVFCLDDKYKIVVRTMRNPRLTGERQGILKITLEDGFVLRSTRNHKFLTTDGTYKEAKNLAIGDGLRTMTRYEASIKDIFQNSSKNSTNYWWTAFGMQSTKAEHRLIAEFREGRRLKTGDVVHHTDKDGLNNRPDNLEVMLRTEHDLLHGQMIAGDNNPMRRAQTEWSDEKWESYSRNMSAAVKEDQNGRYCGQTNDDLRHHALSLTKSIGRRVSNDEWQEYAKQHGLPQMFSKWRMDHLGGIIGLSKWAALECGFEHVDLDPRTLRFYKEVLSEGYDASIEDGRTVVVKACEECGKKFSVIAQRREVGFCSISCHNKSTWKRQDAFTNRLNGMRKAWQVHREKAQEEQVKAFLDLKFRIGREPMKREWVQECKAKKLSFEISRTTSPFRSWDDLKVSASTFNHKVVKVEEDGEEDVYNGTVDEYHNFFFGGFDGKTANQKRKFLYCNGLQCGEIPLENGESCNLCEIFLPRIDDASEFIKISEIMYKVVKSISCLPMIYPETNEIVKRNHRLGISVTGFLQSKYIKDHQMFTDSYKNIEKVDVEYSRVLGVNKSIKLTTVKPSGTVSLLPGVTPGVHPSFSPYYIRRIRMSSNDPLVDQCIKHGYKAEPLMQLDGSRDMNTMVVEFPVKTPAGTLCAKDVSAVQQLEYQKFLQTYWSDNSVSVTVYYNPEELPQIKEWLSKNYNNGVKAVSFLLHKGHGFKQAPYEEITEAQYKEASGKSKPITMIDDKEVMSFKESLECSSGSCPVK